MPRVRIDRITVGERIRKDFGDLEGLANSMADIGQLQEIGVTSNHVLVFGERRLRAARDILQWEEIEAKTVDLDAIILGELHENEMRKDFTVSERVAIGKAIEEYLGNRQGQRTDLSLPKNFQEVEPGKETKEIAAEKAGFGNQMTYRQAIKVIDSAVPELVQAVDDRVIPVSQAVKVAKADPEVQRKVADLSQQGDKKQARQTIQQVYEANRPFAYKSETVQDLTTPEVEVCPHLTHDNVTAELMPIFDEDDIDDEDGVPWENWNNTLRDWMLALQEIGRAGGIDEMTKKWPMPRRVSYLKNLMKFRDAWALRIDEFMMAIGYKG